MTAADDDFEKPKQTKEEEAMAEFIESLFGVEQIKHTDAHDRAQNRRLQSRGFFNEGTE